MRFNEVGVTVFIATHDLKLIEHLGQRRLELHSGKLTVEPDDSFGLAT